MSGPPSPGPVPQHPMGTAPPRSGGSNLTLIGVIVVLLIVIVGGGVFFLAQDDDDDDGTQTTSGTTQTTGGAPQSPGTGDVAPEPGDGPSLTTLPTGDGTMPPVPSDASFSPESTLQGAIGAYTAGDCTAFADYYSTSFTGPDPLSDCMNAAAVDAVATLDSVTTVEESDSAATLTATVTVTAAADTQTSTSTVELIWENQRWLITSWG